MTQQIARHLDRDTTIEFARATRATRKALVPENAAAVFERNASTIVTGQAFHGAFERLLGIPEKFRDGPLCALGARIVRLPINEQQAALGAWLPVARQQQRRSALLNDLVIAGAEGPAGMNEVSLLAVQRGENVQAVAQLFGITEDLITLEIHSVNGPAGAAVRAGGNVQAVAQRFGITGKEPLRTLEMLSVNGPARAAVREGENVQAVAQRLGITENLERLEAISMHGPARAAVRAGENVQAVAQRFGITKQGPLTGLEMISVNGPAGAAVRAGENVQAVAQRFGITENLAILEAMSVNGPAGAAVRAGGNV